MTGHPIRVVALAGIVISAVACAADDQHPLSILQERTPTLSILLKSASSDATLAAAEVELIEQVVCQQAPCPPIALWKGRTDGRGVVHVPASQVHEKTRLRVPGYGDREAAVSAFYVDNRAWTLYLVPDGPIACGTGDDEWTIRVARDWRSAEVRRHDRALEFGALKCSADGRDLPGCGNPDVADAGYIAAFTRSDETLRVKIGAETVKGARPLASLVCRETR
jgi:hypothetical protein